MKIDLAQGFLEGFAFWGGIGYISFEDHYLHKKRNFTG